MPEDVKIVRGGSSNGSQRRLRAQVAGRALRTKIWGCCVFITTTTGEEEKVNNNTLLFFFFFSTIISAEEEEEEAMNHG